MPLLTLKIKVQIMSSTRSTSTAEPAEIENIFMDMFATATIGDVVTLTKCSFKI